MNYKTPLYNIWDKDGGVLMSLYKHIHKITRITISEVNDQCLVTMVLSNYIHTTEVPKEVALTAIESALVYIRGFKGYKQYWDWKRPSPYSFFAMIKERTV